MSNQGRLRAYPEPGRFVSGYECRIETHPAQMYQPDVSPSGSWRRPFSATRPLRTFGAMPAFCPGSTAYGAPLTQRPLPAQRA